MTHSAEILFRLLRTALGQSAGTREGLSLGSVSGEVWKKVIDLSFDQGVAAIAVDGLQKRLEVRGEGFGSTPSTSSGTSSPTENEELALDSPELEDLKYEWFGEVFAREEDYGQQMGAIRKLVGLWSAAGLDTFALKGVAFAQYYPVPEHRYSCDFDCNVRSADGRPAWAEADRIARENGIEVDVLECFMFEISALPELPMAFSEHLWNNMIDHGYHHIFLQRPGHGCIRSDHPDPLQHFHLPAS